MIHSYTNIHPEAKIGENVVVGAFTTIEKDVEIGEGTWIGPNVSIMEGSRIGKNCEIHPGAVISGKPQDLKYKGEKTQTFIGDNTVIRECVTINKGTSDKNKTQIGSHCLLMAYVHIAHDCILGDYCILANSVQVAGHVEIQDHARLGGTTAVHQFVKIGPHTMIGGGSLVRKDVPPYITAAREPLIYSGINSIGLQRSGFSQDKIGEIQEIYRQFFLKGNNKANALKTIKEELPESDEKNIILDFITSSERGIIKGYH
ncbi:acyl-ACP--UDP-N-acetylglucosamine O-acyltransferase [Flexithrix dorotheae]|uniref:acyl-ACP--UDP-N-acetylglucosamine O-acyltransferase n=1 Tax=Flexithrix dorotheae TaxID=70993 RepID=UPI000379BB6B|nr:acyl-ACP--UDP-N-acetylglucosamine O-acyltransferase [Flexithrix dorotheae]